MKIQTLAAIAALGVAVSGCAFTPHDVQIAQPPAPAASTVGTGTKIYFRLVDERDDATVGHRSVATVGAKISAPSIMPTLENSLRGALAAKGYSVVADQGAAAAIATFRLRAFKFDIEMGFWTGGQNASAVLAVDALRQGATYSNVYRSSSEQRILVVPGGDAIDAQLNAALSSIVQQAESDGNLDLFLIGAAQK